MEQETLKKELESLHKEIDTKIEAANESQKDNLNTKVNEEVKKEVNSLVEKYNELTGTQQKQIDELEGKIKKFMEEGASRSKALSLSLSDHIVKELEGTHKDAFDQFALTKKGGPTISIDTKAVGDMSTSASLTETAGTIIPETRVPGIKMLIERTTRMRDLLPGGATTSNQILYVKEVAGEGAITTVAEAGQKPQIDFDLQSAVAPVKKIAGHVKISEELLTDLPAMSGFLGVRIPQKIKLVEDVQIFSGDGSGNNITGLNVNANDGTGSGIVVDNTNAAIQEWDVLVAAASERHQSEYNVNAYVLNTQDFDQMLLQKDTQGRYIAPFIWQNGIPTLRGIPIFLNNVITAGNFLAGDFRMGAQLFDRMGVNVRFYDQDEDNAQKNQITVVGEERLALPIYYDDAFTYGNFATLKVEISS